MRNQIWAWIWASNRPGRGFQVGLGPALGFQRGIGLGVGFKLGIDFGLEFEHGRPWVWNWG